MSAEYRQMELRIGGRSDPPMINLLWSDREPRNSSSRRACPAGLLR